MEIPDAWNLDDDEIPSHPPTPRVYLNSKLAKQVDSASERLTEHISCRCPRLISRRISEIVAGPGRQYGFLTKSDFIIDCIFAGLIEWDKSGMPDGSNGMSRAQFALYRMQLERAVQVGFLEESKELFDELRRSGDVKRLKSLHYYLSVAYDDAVDNAAPSYVDEVQQLMDQTQRLIDAAKQIRD
jgi:hypothetical protein